MESSYIEASCALATYAGVHVNERQVQRVVNLIGPKIDTWAKQREPDSAAEGVPVMYVSYDGTCIPMVKTERQGRKGRDPQKPPKGREIKLGCVFQEGYPLRDPDSTTYITSFKEAEHFGLMMRREAFRRGMAKADQLVVLGDGAHWIWKAARINFPFATCILDFYHACEHLWKLCQALEQEEKDRKTLFKKWKKSFKLDGVARVIEQAQARITAAPKTIPDAARAAEQIDYFTTNIERMRYRTFRKMGFFIGSGVVEAGCKSVVGRRAKQSGMFWTVEGAENVLAIRCCVLEDELDAYWASRKAS